MRRGTASAMLGHVGLRCLIVDDNAQFRATATALLRREGVDVVGAAATIAETLRAGAELRPDVYLVDIDLGPESGLDLARRLHAAAELQPACVVLTSSYAESDYADLIASCPAAGFLAKSRLSFRALQDIVVRGGRPSA
jgi:DNA-binding NarL/FixJ family response regulator